MAVVTCEQNYYSTREHFQALKIDCKKLKIDCKKLKLDCKRLNTKLKYPPSSLVRALAVAGCP